MREEIQKAVEVVKNGGVIIFPTDTAFGIGGRIDKKETIERVFSIKGREENKAVPVLFDSLEMVKKYIKTISPEVLQLMESYWPGALTIVVEANEDVLPEIRGGGQTVGVRVPNQKEIQSLIAAVGVPLIGTSANLSSYPTVYHSDDLDPEVVKQVDLVIEGECREKQSSTVVDVTVTPWKILRQGAVILSL